MSTGRLEPRARLRSVLTLVTDAFGGHGGIALYMRDFLSAACSFPGIESVVAVPRLAPNPLGELPDRLVYDVSGTSGKLGFARAAVRAAFSRRDFDLLVCAHIHLLPVAVPLAAALGAPLALLIYGVDAWQPTPSVVANALVRQCDAVISISQVTLDRFVAWSGFERQRCALLPNAIHLDRYGLGPKNAVLLERYGIGNRKVVMMLGRIVTTERYKGADEVLDIMPSLLRKRPDLVFLVVGDGSDRPRLEARAKAEGLESHVVFCGLIDEAEKADHYRLADAFVMPTYGEGFGFVFLEALACGIPAVGSTVDGSREALRDGLLGQVVDPKDPLALEQAVLRALDAPKAIPEGLEHFSFESFERQCHRLLAWAGTR